MQPDQQKIEELNQLIRDAESIADTAVTATGRRIAICAEIGKRITEIKSNVGSKEWAAWRAKYVPGVESLEKGCIKLHKIKETQPDLFSDPAFMASHARHAGIIPSSQGKTSAAKTLEQRTFETNKRLNARLSELPEGTDYAKNPMHRKALAETALHLARLGVSINNENSHS